MNIDALYSCDLCYEEESYMHSVPVKIKVNANLYHCLTESILQKYGYDANIAKVLREGGTIYLTGPHLKHVCISKRAALEAAIRENNLDCLDYDY